MNNQEITEKVLKAFKKICKKVLDYMNEKDYCNLTKEEFVEEQLECDIKEAISQALAIQEKEFQDKLMKGEHYTKKTMENMKLKEEVKQAKQEGKQEAIKELADDRKALLKEGKCQAEVRAKAKQELWDDIQENLEYSDDEFKHLGLTIGEIKEIKKRHKLV